MQMRKSLSKREKREGTRASSQEPCSTGEGIKGQSSKTREQSGDAVLSCEKARIERY